MRQPTRLPGNSRYCLKYKFGGANAGVAAVRPFVDTGASFRRLTGISQVRNFITGSTQETSSSCRTAGQEFDRICHWRRRGDSSTLPPDLARSAVYAMGNIEFSRRHQQPTGNKPKPSAISGRHLISRNSIARRLRRSPPSTRKLSIGSRCYNRGVFTLTRHPRVPPARWHILAVGSSARSVKLAVLQGTLLLRYIFLPGR